MLRLQDFVKEALIQIATGVHEAQTALTDAEIGVLINPPTVSGEPTGVGQAIDYYSVEQGRLANLVELDIAVAVSKQGAVVVETKPEAVAGASRLRFKVGVALPMPGTSKPKEVPSFELEV